MKLKTKLRRCDYQCNAPPDQQASGTQRCERTDTKFVKVDDFYQHHCSLHQRKQYKAKQKQHTFNATEGVNDGSMD